MTVQVQDTVFRYTANGVTTSFAYSCLVLAEADLVVTVDGAIVTSGFTISGIGSQTGGNVAFITAPANLASVIVQRLVALERQTDYQQHGDWLATVVNKEFDRLWMAEQQQKEQIDRSIKFPVADGALTSELPPAAQRASNLLGFDASGNVVAVAPASQSATALQALLALFSGSSLVGWIQSGVGAILRLVQDKLRDTVSVRDFISTTIDGATSNQTGIVAAVAAAYVAGARLEWPAGTYVSTATIPNFHDVVHFGAGVLKRGTDTWKISGKTGTNRLYVSTTGSDTNDALSAAQPFATIQAAIDAWAEYAGASGTNFVIDLAAGTYTEGAVADGIVSPNELTIEGKLNVGVPSVIIDGTGAASVIGLNFNACGRVRVKYVDAKDWALNVGSSGIAFQNGTRGVIDTCNGSGNAFADFNASEDAEMVIIGTCNIGSGSKYGARYYRLSSGSFGDGTNPITVSGATAAGLQVRDGSKVVCNNGLTLNNCLNGLELIKHGYCELRTTTVSNNTGNGIYADGLSIYDNQTGVVTFSANARNKRFLGLSFDRSALSTTSLINYLFTGKDDVSTLGASSNYDVVVDNNGATGLQFLTNGNNVNIDFDKINRISYVASDTTLRFTLNAVDTYRMKTSSFIPVADNTKSVGEASFRWSVVYAGTGAINTSDEREKQQIKPIDAAALRAWAKVEYCQFKFNDAVEAKGDGAARWHFGVIAQRVKAAFESEGLDAFAHGLLCYDEWPEQQERKDDDGNVTQAYRPAGNRYGIRYEEALVLECAYLRSKLPA